MLRTLQHRKPNPKEPILRAHLLRQMLKKTSLRLRNRMSQVQAEE
jgi:hypothetical protein